MERVARAMDSVGLPSERLNLDYGSKSNGIAYRLFYRDPIHGGLHDTYLVSNGYLGMTAREAWNTLHTIASTLEAVARHNKEAGK